MKNYSKQVEKINQLLSIAEHVPDKQRKGRDESVSVAYFGMGSSNISFVGSENCQTFTENIKDIFNSHKAISATYSIDEFQADVIELLRELRSRGYKCDQERYKAFIDGIENMEVQPHEVFYQISGIRIDGSKEELGDFTIYKFPESSEYLRAMYPSLEGDDFYKRFEKSKYWIGLKVAARDHKKAVELSSSSFELFEDIINYMGLDVDRKSKMTIFSPVVADSLASIVCTLETIASGKTFDDSKIVNLNDLLLKKREFGHDKIWKIATAAIKSDIESRIISAVQWIGKGVAERDHAKGLVQFIFAIEGMFQQSENTIFTPSIVSGISDKLAFLVADDFEKRKEIAGAFKEAYKNRSAVAHGGSKSITKDNLQQAHWLACMMVISFLVKEPYCSMASAKDFNLYIENLKFK